MNYEQALHQADLGFKLTYDGFVGHITGTGLDGGKNKYVHKAGFNSGALSSDADEYEEYKPSAQDKAEEGWYTL